jgi:hypothetical protein
MKRSGEEGEKKYCSVRSKDLPSMMQKISRALSKKERSLQQAQKELVLSKCTTTSKTKKKKRFSTKEDI